MRKELGNGEIILQEAHAIVNHQSFVEGGEETLRCEREGDVGIMFGSVIIEHGVPRMWQNRYQSSWLFVSW